MLAVLAVLVAGLAGWLAVGEVGPARRVLSLSGLPGRRARRSGWVGRLECRLRGMALMLRRRTMEEQARAAVLELCVALAAEVRVGRAPVEALRRGVDALPASSGEILEPVVLTAERGGDVPAALRAASAWPGCRGLGWLAACWQVGIESGAGLADAVDRLAGALRAEQRGRREVAAQLAAPRATARLLAVLPVIGLALATGLGQHPLAFLFGSPSGAACLVVGLGIDLLGVLWTARLARAAEPG